MRPHLAIVLAALCVGGCARHRSHVESARQSDPFSRARPAAAALVFEPSVSGDMPFEALARGGREPQAFVGYPEGEAEYFSLRWDDRQSNWGHGHGGGFDDRFERRAVSERVGVLYR